MVPKGWIEENICAVLERIIDYRGQSVPKSNTGIKLITAKNVRFGFLDLTEQEYISDDSYVDWMKRGLPQSGDILFTTEAPLGNACRFPAGDRFAVGQRTITLRTNQKLDSEYLLYYLLSDKGQRLIDFRSSGSTAKGIKSSEFKKLQITYPQLISEQRKIAKILSTWDKAITTTERLLTSRQQQKKALMQRLLTGKQRFAGFEGEWCITTLGEVFSKITNGLTYDARATEGLPVTRIETISTGFVNYVKVGWAPANENTKRFRLQYGDILYSHINSLEHIGRVAFYREEYPLYHGMNLLLLRPNDKVIPEFVYYVLNSQIGKRYAKLYAKAAVNQASISTTEIKTFKIKIPNKNEQQKIASVLSAADAEISTIQNQLNNLKQQKKALMQQLLTGKRRVKVDSPALATQ